MFYSNLLNLKNITYKNINLHSFMKGINTVYDESILPNGYSRETYNFDYSDGALKDGLGISEPSVKYSRNDPTLTKILNIPVNFKVWGCWLFPGWHETVDVYYPLVIIYCANGKFYYNDLHSSQTNFVEIPNLVFYEKPIVTNYNLNGVDTLLLVSKEDGMYKWSTVSGVEKVEGAPCINSMCVHYERLFVTTSDNERRVWFSDDLNPTNFNISADEGGFIDLMDNFGRSNKVVSFDGYVYVFRDYNIAKVSAFAEQENFSVTQLYVGNGRILKNTVSICGNKIMYLATDGLYSFNGVSVSKINLGISNIFDGNNESAVAGYCNGCYYLACRLCYDEDSTNAGLDFNENNTLIKYDVFSGKFSLLKNCDVRDISVINDSREVTVFVVVNEGENSRLGMVDNSGSIWSTPTEKVWYLPKSDFDYPDRYKLIKEISLETRSDCVIKVMADNKEKSFVVKGKDGISIIKPRMKGVKISIGIVSNTVNTKITNLQMRVGIL